MEIWTVILELDVHGVAYESQDLLCDMTNM
jgi:hypothetical protein